MKKRMPRLLSLLLALSLALSIGAVSALAAEPGDPVTNGGEYTTVFVHGLLGWGDDDKLTKKLPYWGGSTRENMPQYLNSLGYDTFVASVGPISSLWDRACDLFAQLTGTCADYGQAHADRSTAEFRENHSGLKHARYGRDYSGKRALDDWGPIYDGNGKVTGWYDNKINLIGHSLGGPTIMVFLQLLAEGDEAEREWGMQQAAEYGGDWHDYVSPLFWGDYDGEYLVNSITSLAGVLNGTSYLDIVGPLTAIRSTVIMMIANLISSGYLDWTYLYTVYDFQLDQFGFSKISGGPDAIFSILKQKGYIDGTDNAAYDLSVQRCNELKQGWKTYENVYYFGYAGDKTVDFTAPCGNYHINVASMGMFLPSQGFSTMMGMYTNKNVPVLDVNGNVYGYIDASWHPNDGLVNTVSALYPLGAPHKDYDPDHVESGVWNLMPILNYDHFDFVGGIGSVYLTRSKVEKFYTGIMDTLCRTTPVDRAPVMTAAAGPDYLRLTNESGETAAVTWEPCGEAAVEPQLQYRTDAMTDWADVSLGGAISVDAGQSVCFRGSNATLGSADDGYIRLTCDKACSLSGDITTLLDPAGNVTELTEEQSACFAYLFRGMETLTDVSGLLLPTGALSESGYEGMFEGCTALTAAESEPVEDEMSESEIAEAEEPAPVEEELPESEIPAAEEPALEDQIIPAA